MQVEEDAGKELVEHFTASRLQSAALHQSPMG